MTTLRLNPAPFVAAATGALMTLVVVAPVLMLLHSGVLDDSFDVLRDLADRLIAAVQAPDIGQLMFATLACMLCGGAERAKASKTLGPYAVLVYGLTSLYTACPLVPVALLLPVMILWPIPRKPL